MKLFRILSDDEIRLRFGPHRYPNPFRHGSFFAEQENAINAARGLLAELLVAFARVLRGVRS